jgi:coiled-coil domain-containing protein 55
MNINISKKRTSDKAPKSDLEMGLNSRGGEVIPSSKNRKRASALDDTDDEDDDGDDEQVNDDNRNISGREAVNRSIAKQQAAIRAQAAAAAMSMDASIYDYDGVYDSIHTNKKTAVMTSTTTEDTRKSRYIEDLMKTAKVRKMERDIAYDRKVARDQQAEEEVEPEFRNKDRFITSSYKRQLEERHQYEQQESIRQKMDAQNDITQRSDGGFGIARFYGNITQQQQSTPWTNPDDDTRITPSISTITQDQQNNNSSPLMRETSTTTGSRSNDDNTDHSRPHDTSTSSQHQKPSTTTTTTITAAKDDWHNEERTNMRLVRDRKVQAARHRYFQRHPNISAVTME